MLRNALKFNKEKGKIAVLVFWVPKENYTDEDFSFSYLNFVLENNMNENPPMDFLKMVTNKRIKI